MLRYALITHICPDGLISSVALITDVLSVETSVFPSPNNRPVLFFNAYLSQLSPPQTWHLLADDIFIRLQHKCIRVEVNSINHINSIGHENHFNSHFFVEEAVDFNLIKSPCSKSNPIPPWWVGLACWIMSQRNKSLIAVTYLSN